MKNKKLIYLLIPLALLIWGNLFYKIFTTVYGNDSGKKTAIDFLAVQNNDSLSDKFSINPDYRDPFLSKSQKNNISKTNSRVSDKDQKSSKPQKQLPVESSWPVINYSGIIKNNKSNKQLVMLQINGQNNMMKVGDRINDIELTKVFKDSIEVRFGKEKKYVKK